MFRQLRNAPGFTLIELLICVAIIAVLAAIALPNLLETQVRARTSRTRADLSALATALEIYAVDAAHYPPYGVINADGTVQNPHRTPAGNAAHKFLNEALTTPLAYVSSLAHDPMLTTRSPAGVTAEEPFARFFYTNLDWFAAVMQPNPPGVIATMRERYGIWILAGCGPDGDRLDLARNLAYDPTNGTLSDGDLILSAKRQPN